MAEMVGQPLPGFGPDAHLLPAERAAWDQIHKRDRDALAVLRHVDALAKKLEQPEYVAFSVVGDKVKTHSWGTVRDEALRFSLTSGLLGTVTETPHGQAPAGQTHRWVKFNVYPHYIGTYRIPVKNLHLPGGTTTIEHAEKLLEAIKAAKEERAKYIHPDNIGPPQNLPANRADQTVKKHHPTEEDHLVYIPFSGYSAHFFRYSAHAHIFGGFFERGHQCLRMDLFNFDFVRAIYKSIRSRIWEVRTNEFQRTSKNVNL